MKLKPTIFLASLFVILSAALAITNNAVTGSLTFSLALFMSDTLWSISLFISNGWYAWVIVLLIMVTLLAIILLLYFLRYKTQLEKVKIHFYISSAIQAIAIGLFITLLILFTKNNKLDYAFGGVCCLATSVSALIYLLSILMVKSLQDQTIQLTQIASIALMVFQGICLFKSCFIETYKLLASVVNSNYIVMGITNYVVNIAVELGMFYIIGLLINFISGYESEDDNELMETSCKKMWNLSLTYIVVSVITMAGLNIVRIIPVFFGVTPSYSVIITYLIIIVVVNMFAQLLRYHKLSMLNK